MSANLPKTNKFCLLLTLSLLIGQTALPLGALAQSSNVEQAPALTLPNYWGEMLTAKDLWNLAVNGEMSRAPFGTLTPLLGLAGLAWVLWASWKHQAEEAGLPARLRDWFLGGLDALLIGLIPLLLPCLLAFKLLDALASTGIQGLNWMAFAGKPLLTFAFVSAWMGQWSLCRLNRAAAADLAVSTTFQPGSGGGGDASDGCS